MPKDFSTKSLAEAWLISELTDNQILEIVDYQINENEYPLLTHQRQLLPIRCVFRATQLLPHFPMFV